MSARRGTDKSQFSVFRAVFIKAWQRATTELGLQNLTGRRALHVHSTSVIDAKGTRGVLLNGKSQVPGKNEVRT